MSLELRGGDFLRAASLGVVLLTPTLAVAATWPVCDVATFKAAAVAVSPGDVIEFEPGDYQLPQTGISVSGTAAQPITIRARVPLTARLLIDGAEGLSIIGDYIVIEDLWMQGVCANDNDCQIAIHISGSHAVVKRSVFRDFNKSIRANAFARSDGGFGIPDFGLVEGNDVAATHPRATNDALAQISVGSGSNWVIRDNFIVGASYGAPGGSTYGIALGVGGSNSIIERNIVLCREGAVDSSAVELGIGFGPGSNVGPPCAAVGTLCDPEYSNTIIRNNLVANCSDVAVYLNRAANTRVLYNTLINTNGVDFRAASTTATVEGNLLTSILRARGGTFTNQFNNQDLAVATFDALMPAWAQGDLTATGDLSAWLGVGAARVDVADDVCGRTRPSGGRTLGAVEYSLGNCVTARRLPVVAPGQLAKCSVPADAGVQADGGLDADGGIDQVNPAFALGVGCGCHTGSYMSSCVAALVLVLRRRRR